MKPLPRWLITTLVACGGGLVFLTATLLFIPASEVQHLAVRACARQGLTLTTLDFGKAFPLGLHARGLAIADERGTLVKLDRATVRLRLLPLLAGRIVVAGDAAIGAGSLKGELELTRSGRLELAGQGIRLEDIPFFATVADARAKGELWLRGNIRGKGAKASGTLQLEVRDVDLRGVKISGTPLPDAAYKTIQGALRINAGRLTMESVTLAGEGLYARLKGDIPLVAAPAGSLNLTLELMPRPEFMEQQKFIFLLLAKYLTTPGHYQIPIRGTLSRPVLQ